ncbi:MAG: hypothetical protein Ta2E_08070 [Mycoplasmoidaceae bacterium]|nr:MAG: hypothetical protein Ta2E_08070 [Mycoplasmoidaceae bacterium]
MKDKQTIDFNITYKPKIVLWKFILQILIVTLIIVGIETLDYFVIAKYFGQWESKIGTNEPYVLNLQTWIDKIMPWFTSIYAYYIAWPFIWFIIIPAFIYLSSGKHGYYQYVINSLMMYIAGMIIYALIPTTCTPANFIGKNGWDASINKPFHNELEKLANDNNNIYGSCPSYHNYWAALFIFFGFKKGVKAHWRSIMLTLGTLISVSTLLLHQHNVIDVIVTYAMTYCFIVIEKKYDFANRFEKLLNKIFKVEFPIVNKNK